MSSFPYIPFQRLKIKVEDRDVLMIVIVINKNNQLVSEENLRTAGLPEKADCLGIEKF